MNINPLHLYRSLLRECTYLPDKKARVWASDYVTSRFRRYVPKYTNLNRPKSEIPFKRKVKILHNGRKLLSMLSRANGGYVKPLEKIFRYTYGRIGPRRYELLKPVTARDNAEDLQLDGKAVPKTYDTGWEPSVLFQSLIQSQANQGGRLQMNAKLHPVFKFPTTNIWARPMPRSRTKNARHKWYVKNLQQLLPPLAEKEWLELRRRAHDEDWDIAQRRSRAHVGSSTSSEQTDLPEIVDESTVVLDGPEKAAIRTKKQDRPHAMTPRYVSRLVSRTILRHSPMIVTDEDGIYHFRWDSGKTRSHKPQEVDSAQVAALFGS